MSTHGRLGKTCRGRWLLPVLALLVILCMSACSDSPKDGERAAVSKGPDQRSHNLATGERPLHGGLLSDRGGACATHRYVLAPGTTTTLSFEVALSPQQSASIAADELQIHKNQWEEIGVAASLGYCRVESADASQVRWVVDGSEFLRDRRELGKTPTSTTIGDVVIVWGNDGYGTLSQTRRARTAAGLGKLSEAQIADELGGSVTVEYADVDTDNTYTWIAEQRSTEKAVQVLVIELTVDTPAGAKDTTLKHLEVGAPSTGWNIGAQYSDFRGVFVVTGPGQRLDCLADGGV